MLPEVAQAYDYLGYVVLTGIGLFLLRIVLTVLLRKRFAQGLIPEITEVNRSDGGTRLFALIGQRAEVQRTLGTSRLRASLGLTLLYWGVLAAMVYVTGLMGAPPLGQATLVLLLVLYLAIHTSLYEITYDRDTITLPRWWFGRTTRKWRDLEAVVERQGWYLNFHFRDGTVIQAHKYVVGYAELREAAAAVLREV